MVNYAVMQMVMAKQNMIRRELEGDVPVLDTASPLVPDVDWQS